MVTQEQLDALDAAIAGGLTEVRSGEKVVRYQTTADMIAARAALARQLRLQADAALGSPRIQLADFSD